MLLVIGLSLMLFGWLLMFLAAFDNEPNNGERFLWSLFIFAFPPAGTIYWYKKDRGLIPVIMFWAGLLTFGVGFLIGEKFSDLK